MNNAMDVEQSSDRVLEITPFIPLILRGKFLEKLNFYCVEDYTRVIS